jgi:RNA polymerase sigma-70 factor (ECF subfamily)
MPDTDYQHAKPLSGGFAPTRRSLLTRLKRWDNQQSWQDFFNTYWKLIHSVAVKSGLTEHEAQDVVQETIITVAKRIPAFNYDPALGSFKGWLLTIVRWRIADQFRKRAPFAEHGTAETEGEDSRRTGTLDRIPDPAGLGLESIWDQEWRENVVSAACERVKRHVSAKQYQIFDLYVLKEWPVRKVCDTMKVSATQVYLARHRVSKLLKKESTRIETSMA